MLHCMIRKENSAVSLVLHIVQPHAPVRSLLRQDLLNIISRRRTAYIAEKFAASIPPSATSFWQSPDYSGTYLMKCSRSGQAEL